MESPDGVKPNSQFFSVNTRILKNNLVTNDYADDLSGDEDQSFRNFGGSYGVGHIKVHDYINDNNVTLTSEDFS